MTDRKRATIGILFGLFLAAMDGTIVGTALPTIVSHFGHVELYFLPISVALIVATISVPVFGRLSDMYGRKRFHFIAILLFCTGSFLCSIAESMFALIGFRAIQAAGQGALMTLSYTMIADLYSADQRARIQGSIGGLWGIAALLGPPLGGVITARLGWEFVFRVTIPLGLISLLIIQRVWKDVPRPARVARPDYPGAVLLVLASAAILAAFSFGRDPYQGWNSPLTLGLFGAAAILTVSLGIVERVSRDPFMSVGLFRNRLFWTGTLCSSLLAATMFSGFAYLPLFVQSVLGQTPTMAGLILTPMMFAWVTCSASGGFLVRRVGFRSLAITGSLLAGTGYFLLGRLTAHSTWGDAAIADAVLGAGLGFVMAPLLIAAQNSAGSERLGAATSLTQFCRSMAGALGVALAGAVMSSSLAAHGIDPDQVVNPVLRKQLSPEESAALRDVMAESIRPVFRIGLGTAALAFLAALLLPAGRARDLRSAEAARTPGSPRG